jgi:hypothetical protein
VEAGCGKRLRRAHCTGLRPPFRSRCSTSCMPDSEFRFRCFLNDCETTGWGGSDESRGRRVRRRSSEWLLVQWRDYRRLRKGPHRSAVEGRSGYKEFSAFVTRYLGPAQLSDPAVVYGFTAATLMTHVSKQRGDDLSRENILRQATNIRDFELKMGLPGTRVNTSPESNFSIRKTQLSRFNGHRSGVHARQR